MEDGAKPLESMANFTEVKTTPQLNMMTAKKYGIGMTNFIGKTTNPQPSITTVKKDGTCTAHVIAQTIYLQLN